MSGQRNNYEEYFLPLKDRKAQKKLFSELIDLCFDFYSGKTRNNKFLIYKSPEELKKMVAESLPHKGIKVNNLLKILKDPIGKYSIAQFDQDYLAFPDSGNAVPAFLADIYSKFLNQNMINFTRSAPVATFIEIQLIEWLREIIGYDYKPLEKINSLSEVSGMITTGGCMSNNICVMAALNYSFPEIKGKGLTSLNFQPAIIMSGAISHYSYSSAAHQLGIGQDSLLIAGATPQYTTDLESVEELLKNPPEGKRPFMVVGVAGNSRTTGIDDLNGLEKLCRKYNVWFHTDACHGGCLLFSKKHRKRLDGIEKADSVSLDPHKGLFSPYPLSFAMFKQRDTLVRFTRYEEKVRSGEAWDLGYITPFYGSRGFESLKMWLTIKALGVDGIGKIVDDRQKISAYISEIIIKSKYFSVFNEMSFYRMVFVYYPQKIKDRVDKEKLSFEQKLKIKQFIDDFTHKINEKLYTSGELCLDEFKLDDLGNFTNLETKDKFVVMSISIGNPKHTKKTIRKALNKLFKLCEANLPLMNKKVMGVINRTNDLSIKKDTKNYGPAGWD